jgi:phage-related protein
MAVVGSASVVVNVITSGVDKQLSGAFSGGDRIGRAAGKKASAGFSKGFAGGGGGKRLFSDQFFKEADRARKTFQRLLRVGYALTPALTALAGVLGNAAGALFLLATAAGTAAPALIVLPASLFAIAQAAVVAKVALMGVGKAIQAGLKPLKSGAAENKALENALERLEEARIRLARAEEDRAEIIADANKKIVDAEEDYIDSQYESEKAAKALSKAREEATEDLQQLRFETEDAAISEQKARLEFERSRESLQRVQDLPPNSRARREAELAFAEADLNLRRSIDKNSDLKKAEAEATAAGVDGSEKVLDASEALAEAKEREQKAYEAVGEAALDAARAQRDANRAVADAERALAEAKEDVADAAKGAKDSVDQFAEAMKRLSPEAQDFVRYMLSLKDSFQELRAAAGREFFPKLTLAIDNLVTNLLPKLNPLFERTGSILGDVAMDISNVVTSTENIGRLERIWSTNDQLIGNFGRSVGNLYEVLLILLDAAEPLIREFGEWIETITEGWQQTLNAEGAFDRLRGSFERAGEVAKLLGEILGNIFTGVVNLGKAANSGGALDLFLTRMRDATESFENFTGSEAGRKKAEEYFLGTAENALTLGRIVGKLLKPFGEIGASEDFGNFLGSLERAVETLTDTLDDLLADGILTSFGLFIEEFATTIAGFTVGGGITVFFDTLTGILEVINNIITSDIGKKLITTFSPILAFFSALGFAGGIAKFFGKVIVGTLGSAFGVLTGIFGAFSTAFRFLMTFFRNPAIIVRFISIAIAPLASAVGLAVGPFLLIVGAIALLVGILVGAYKASEDFRTAVSELFAVVKESIVGALDQVKASFEDAFGPIDDIKTKIMDGFKVIGDFIATYVIPIFKVIIPAAIGYLGGIISGLIYVVKAVWDYFTFAFNMIKGIFKLFTGDTEGAVAAFKKAWEGLKSFFKNIVKAIYAPFAGLVNGIIRGINSIIRAKNKLTDNQTAELSLLPTVLDFAEGGTVYPRSGGVIARVAEAGRPERIEPLDPNGLSERDKAIVKMFAGGSGAGTGPTINVYPSQGMDERQLAEIVSRKLAFQMRKGGI